MQTMFRATIMLASLFAGAWAYQEYGPEEGLRPLGTKAIELADDLLGRRADVALRPPARASTPPAPETRLTAEPATGRMTSVSPSPPAGEECRKTASCCSPGGPDAPQPTESPNDPLKVAIGELEMLGAKKVNVSRWGQSAGLHRVTCELPIAGGGHMWRHLEAVAAAPAAAAADVLRQARRWQGASLTAVR